MENIRADFPILREQINGYPLAYLDNAATTQKPQTVIDALTKYYTSMNANIHRGVHYLSEQATSAYEHTRVKIQQFINAPCAKNCIFVRGATEAINLVAASYGGLVVHSGDEILISQMEHHSNIVPWQILCERTGAQLKYIPLTNSGELDLTNLEQLLTAKTKIVAIVYASNSLGTVNPVKHIIKLAHSKNIPVLLDGAQATAHFTVDVQDLDCDFYVLSSHKMYGPTGIGVLYGKEELLEQMPPYQSGGDMILQVTMDKSSYHELPYKFEAGTPAIAAVIAFGAAIDYLANLDSNLIQQYEQDLLHYAEQQLANVPGVQIIGQAKHKISLVSFTLDNIHAHDIGSIVNQYGVAIRTGHHCTMPILDYYGLAATARASLAIYNNRQDIDQLCNALLKVRNMFSR